MSGHPLRGLVRGRPTGLPPVRVVSPSAVIRLFREMRADAPSPLRALRDAAPGARPHPPRRPPEDAEMNEPEVLLISQDAAWIRMAEGLIRGVGSLGVAIVGNLDGAYSYAGWDRVALVL